MKNTVVLTIRNFNILFLIVLFMGLFFVGKKNCGYYIFLSILGADLLAQGLFSIWFPSMFMYFISIDEQELNAIPAWKDFAPLEKVRSFIMSLFILFWGYNSLHGGLIALRQLSCIHFFR